MPPSEILERYDLVPIWQLASTQGGQHLGKEPEISAHPCSQETVQGLCALLPAHAVNGLSLEKGSGFQLNYVLFDEPGFFGKDEGS